MNELQKAFQSKYFSICGYFMSDGFFFRLGAQTRIADVGIQGDSHWAIFDPTIFCEFQII